MKYDPLVPAPLLAVARCVLFWIACVLLGDATGLYSTEVGSALMHWIYDYDPSMSHDLARYHDEEGDALFVVLTAPMFVAVAISIVYHTVRHFLKRHIRTVVVPAE